MPRTLFITLGLAGFLLGSSLKADNWPGWRGPGNQGISTEKAFPLEWSDTKNVKWKVPLSGNGVSQPIVWEDHIFLTGSDGRLNDRLHVYAYHRKDGRLLWHTRLLGTAPTDLYPQGGMAVPTPVTDGNNVYCLFGTGDLAALDFQGRPVWIRSLAQEYGPFRNRWGMGTSPILVQGTLVVQVDHWGPSYLLGVDPETGANRWKTDRPGAVNWTSPLLVEVKKHPEILTFGTHWVRAYDARNGAELWQIEGMHNQCIPSPVAEGTTLIACSGENTMGIQLDGSTGDLTKSHVLWKNKKASAFVTSPVLYQGLLYIPADKGFVTCLEVKKGQQVWKERLGEGFHAAPVAAGGRLYFLAKEGFVRVVQAGRDFKLLAENPMGEELIASPAFSQGQIIIRGEKHLFLIGP